MFRNPLADGLIILVLVLLFVGPKRLPMLSRSIGESIKEFKGGVSEHSGAGDKQLDASEPTPTAESAETKQSAV